MELRTDDLNPNETEQSGHTAQCDGITKFPALQSFWVLQRTVLAVAKFSSWSRMFHSCLFT